MKKFIACGILTVVGSACLNAQIAQWNFDNLTLSPSYTNSSSLFNVPADVGSGTASGLHTPGAPYSTPAGNGSPKSISSSFWSVGDYWQFQVSTLGSSGIIVSFDQNGSATGPRDFYFAYSTDGSTFTKVGSDYALASGITWATGTPGQGTHESFDLSALTVLNNNSTVYLRIVNDSTTSINGGTIGTAGTDRIDNFTVAVVPEPTSLFVFGGFTLLAWNLIRRRK